jgi:hypothetical protein
MLPNFHFFIGEQKKIARFGTADRFSSFIGFISNTPGFLVFSFEKNPILPLLFLGL